MEKKTYVIWSKSWSRYTIGVLEYCGYDILRIERFKRGCCKITIVGIDDPKDRLASIFKISNPKSEEPAEYLW